MNRNRILESTGPRTKMVMTSGCYSWYSSVTVQTPNLEEFKTLITIEENFNKMISFLRK